MLAGLLLAFRVWCFVAYGLIADVVVLYFGCLVWCVVFGASLGWCFAGLFSLVVVLR